MKRKVMRLKDADNINDFRCWVRKQFNATKKLKIKKIKLGYKG